jgi:hypothetical protein
MIALTSKLVPTDLGDVGGIIGTFSAISTLPWLNIPIP